MPSDEETRLQKELSDQLAESQKWFGKIKRINELIGSVEDAEVYVGGSKALGLFGGAMAGFGIAPAPGASVSTTELVRAIHRILRD